MIKIPSLFTKTPKHKRFNFTPRHYDAMEEERKAREERIRSELQAEGKDIIIDDSYRTRMAGSFRASKKTQGRQFDPSANLLRIIIITILVVWLIAYIQFGQPALYALLLIVPVYVWIRFVRR
jgi:Flp pilus assembly protein TadB